jgi:hypothetical protein
MAHLKHIEKYSYAFVELPVDNVYDCVFKVAEYEAVRRGSYPLRHLLEASTVPVDRKWLARWEVLSRLGLPHIHRAVCDDEVSDVIQKYSPECIIGGSNPQLYFAVGWPTEVTVSKGCMVCVELEHIATAAQLTAIATLPATKMRLIHCSADDRMYLAWVSTGGKIPAIGDEPNATNIDPASMEPLEKALISTLGSLYQWRSDYYEELIGKLSTLDTSHAAKDFDGWIDNFITASFKDVSAEWADATGFPFWLAEIPAGHGTHDNMVALGR